MAFHRCQGLPSHEITCSRMRLCQEDASGRPQGSWAERQEQNRPFWKQRVHQPRASGNSCQKLCRDEQKTLSCVRGQPGAEHWKPHSGFFPVIKEGKPGNYGVGKGQSGGLGGWEYGGSPACLSGPWMKWFARWTSPAYVRHSHVPTETFIEPILIHVSIDVEVFSRREGQLSFGVLVRSIEGVVTAGKTQLLR